MAGFVVVAVPASGPSSMSASASHVRFILHIGTRVYTNTILILHLPVSRSASIFDDDAVVAMLLVHVVELGGSTVCHHSYAGMNVEPKAVP